MPIIYNDDNSFMIITGIFEDDDRVTTDEFLDRIYSYKTGTYIKLYISGDLNDSPDKSISREIVRTSDGKWTNVPGRSTDPKMTDLEVINFVQLKRIKNIGVITPWRNYNK